MRTALDSRSAAEKKAVASIEKERGKKMRLHWKLETIVIVGCALSFSTQPAALAQSVLTNPAGNQTVTQPGGTSLLVNTLRAKSLDGVLNAAEHCTVPGTLDQTCINNAIAAAPAGGTVFISPGNYSINYSIYVAKAINLVGAGPQSTTLTAKPSLGIYNMIQVDAWMGAHVGPVVIREFTMRSDYDRGTGGYGIAILITNSGGTGPVDVRVEDVDIRTDTTNKHGHGIVVQACYQLLLRNVYIRDVQHQGLRLAGLSPSAWVISTTLENVRVGSGEREGGSLVVDSYVDGLYGSRVILEGDAMAPHLWIKDTANVGGYVNPSSPRSIFFNQLVADFGKAEGVKIDGGRHIKLENAWIGSNKLDGVKIGASANYFANISIADSTIIANEHSGINLGGSSDFSVYDSLIAQNGAANGGCPGTGLYSGIKVAEGVGYFHIGGNRFNHNAASGGGITHKYAVELGGNNDNYMIVGNDMYGYCTAALSATPGVRKKIDNLN